MSHLDPSIAGLRNLLSASVHEINNALAPILLYGDLIRETSQEGPTREKVTAILGQADKILRDLDALRFLYREPQEEAIAPALLASHAARLLNPIFRKAGNRVRWWAEAGPSQVGAGAPETRLRNLIALAEFAQRPQAALSLVWLRRPQGVELLVLQAPESPTGPFGDGPKDDWPVRTIAPEEVPRLLADHPALPLHRQVWD